jgi:hypothetical protein
MQGFLVSRAVPADDVPHVLLTSTLLAWPVASEGPIVADAPAQTTSGLPVDGRVTAVLEAVCRSEVPAALDVDVVESVITALHSRPSPMRRVPGRATSAA